MKLRWSNEAIDELAAISDFVAQFSATYGGELTARILEAADKLIQFPELGRKNAALGSEHVRELLVEKYRLVYYTDNQLITILSIRHQALNR